MKRILSVVLAVLMCVLPLTANVAAAEVPSSAKAVYTFSDAAAYAGEDVTVTLSLETFVAFKAAGVAGITYDEDALIFNGATIEDAFGNLMFVKSFTAENMTLVAAAMSAIDSYNGTVLKLDFTIKDDAEVGEYEITGTPSFQDATAVAESFLIPGTVTVKGQDFTGLSFKDKTVTYDSEVQNIEVTGVPDFATVAYTVDGDEFDGAEDAGTYEVTATVTAPGYNKWKKTATLEITKKNLTVNVIVPAKEYDGTTTIENYADYVSMTGLIDGDDVELDISELHYDIPNAVVMQNVIGNVGVNGSDLGNYEVAYNRPQVAITQKPITVKADDVTVKVGADMPELTYTAEGLVEGDTLLGITLTTKANTRTVKEYPITVKADSNYDKNYKITTKNGTFKVIDKTEQEVIVPEADDVTYGDEGFNLGVTLGEVVNDSAVEYKSLTPAVVSVDNDGQVTILGAGTAKIEVTKAGDADYADFSETVTFTVAKKGLTVTAKDVTVMKTVGTIPAKEDLEYDVEGLVNGDTKADVFTGALATTAKNSNTVKTYPITKGTLKVNANYVIELFDEGTLSVIDKTPQDITVTSNAPSAIVYGDEGFKIDVAYGETVTEAETVFASTNNEVATVDANGKVTIVGAGTAKITVSKAGDADLADFSKTVTVTVAKKAIKVSADPKEKYVGEDTPVLTYTTDVELVGDDEFTGALTVNDKDVAGKFYDIKIGTLALNDNYKVTYVGAKLKVLAKVEQQITVSDVDIFTYGVNTGFAVEITYDGEYNTESGITFESSNEDVATVDAEGNVTIVGAGDARITVAFEGNYKFYPYEETVFVTVDKADLDFVINDQIKKIGTADPELTFSYTGLVDGDEIIGAPEREAGEELGEYDIKPGTLSVSCPENYNIGYTWGILTIVDKTPQTVEVTGIPEESLVYGGEGFTVAATSAEVAGAQVTYVSSDENVITVDENGKVTVVGAGEAVITVTVAGNDDYADAVVTKAVVVAAKEIAVTELDLVNKTVTFDAVLEADKEAVTLDFDKLTLTPEDVEEGQTPENYVVTGLELAGDKSASYALTTESFLVPISEEIALVTVSAVAENGSVEGTGTYLAGSEITLTATPNSGYKFSGWYAGEEKVSSDAEYTFTAEDDIELTAKFAKKSTGSIGGGGGTPTRTVYFKVDEENTVTATVEKGAKVEKPEDPALEGYIFGGWYTDAECTKEYDFGKAVDTSITLYAKWTAVEEPDDGENKTDEGEEKPEEWTNPYTDVDEGDWYYEVVKAATEAGIMNGVSEDTFAPDTLVTRAMIVTMLHRAEGEPAAEEEAPFEDLDQSAYYADAVAWAAENGIVLGVSETEFAPDANVTREQIAAIIFRYAAYKGVEAIELSENLFFDDADKISEYAVAPMNWLVGKEIITGYEDGTVRPQGNATRAEVAAITARILAFLAE